MELIKFVLSSFWVWLGFVVLVGLILSQVVELVKACKQGRKVATYRMGDVYRVEIESATSRDAEKALRGERVPGQPVGGAGNAE